MNIPWDHTIGAKTKMLVSGSDTVAGLVSAARGKGPVMLDLGCGTRKKQGSIGIDLIAHPGVDVVGDVVEVLKEFPAGSVDEIVSSHFVEHVANLETLVEQIVRVCKNGARIELVVPHFSNPYFYSDYTHRQPFGLYTFCYFAEYDRSCLKRVVPKYRSFPGLRLVSVDLCFKTSRPFYIRYLFEKVVGALFNSSRVMRELYERAFCYIWPCYELKFVLTKTA